MCCFSVRGASASRFSAPSCSFVSFLFYNGLVTVTDAGALRTRLGIPNQTVGEFLHDFIGRAYGDVYGVGSRVFDIANGMIVFHGTEIALCEELP